MKRARRFFSPEFKAEAVKLIKERGYSVSQACRELDIGETALRRWISQVEAENQGYILPANRFPPNNSALTSWKNASKNWKKTSAF